MKTLVKFALIFVVLSFIWNCAEYAMGLHDDHINIHPYFVTPFFLIMTAVIYYFALSSKRDENKGSITFSQLFLAGLVLTIFILILNPVFLYIFYKFINPEFFNSYIAYDTLSGKMSIQEASDYYNMRNFILRGSIYRFIIGIVATVIIYFFMKRTLKS